MFPHTTPWGGALGAILLSSLLLAATAASACGNFATADQSILVAPAITPTRSPSPPLPAVGLAVVGVVDVTTSANRFGGTALELFAEQVRSWPAPARGGLEVFLNVLSSTSYDATSTLFVGQLGGLPPTPVRRAALARPEMPSVERCNENAFSRAKCEAAATAGYNAALQAALDDEQAAEDEFRVATAAFQDLLLFRQSEAVVLAAALQALALPVDDRGSDVDGALLRASEQLRTSTAPKKLLVIWSDLEPYGPQQPGTLDLTGIDIVIVHDCPQGIDCSARRTAIAARLTSAGTDSVTWLDPATAQISHLFQEVH